MAFKYLRVLSPAQIRRLIPVFFLILVSSCLEVFGLGLLIPFFQYLSDPSSADALPAFLQKLLALLPGDESQTGLALAGLLITVFVLKGAISIFTTWHQTRTVFSLYRETAGKVLENYLNAPVTYLASKNSTELIRTVGQDTQAYFHQFVLPWLSLVAELMTLTAIIAMMFIVDPVVTIVAGVGLGLTGAGVLRAIRKMIIHWGYRRRDAFGEMFRWVSQGIGGIKETQILGRQRYFVREFDRAAADLSHATTGSTTVNAMPRFVLETMVVVTLVVFTAVLQGTGDPVSVWMPRLVFFGAAAIRLAPSMVRCLTYLNTVRATIASAAVVYEGIYELPRHVEDSGGPVEALPFKREITFDRVTYAYPNTDSPALNAVSFRIQAGTTVALVGPTGAGKTTAVDVLLGLSRPDQGAVLVDGVPITHQESRWQKNLGYVPQFIYLSDLSIAENVAFGVEREDIDEAQLWRALEGAWIADFVRTLPEGIHTRVGERGVMLSGGQRQRIGIARALYFDPAVLVMDEATSALDSETEKRISEATEALQGHKTMVLIAHRLTTVRHADQILIFDQGAIADAGTFDELVERSELFRRLARGLEGVDAEAVEA